MNPGFQSDEFTLSTKDGRNFMFMEDADYVSKTGVHYRIPIGATTDGASTPRGTWNVLPPFGAYWRPAALHDAAYRNTLLVFDGTDFRVANLAKVECDLLLREAMQLCGVNDLEENAIYEGVALGGQSSFDQDRKA